MYEWFVSTASGFLTIVPWVVVLALFMLIDIATGMGFSLITKSVSSSYCREGMIRKAMVMAMVATGMLFEVLMDLAVMNLPKEVQPSGGLILGFPWGAFIAFLFSIVAVTSILENVAKSGLPIPKRLVDIFAAVSHNEIIGKRRLTMEIDQLNVRNAKVDSDVVTHKADTKTALTAEEATDVEKILEKRRTRESAKNGT